MQDIDGVARHVDVAIVGAGITGLSVAWHLARRQAGAIAVLERTGIGAEASGVQPGGVRQQWSTRVSCDLAKESLDFYLDVADRLDARARPRLDQCGYLFVADTDEMLATLEANIAVQQSFGVPSRLVTPAESTSLVPGLLADGMAGASWCSEDGYFDKPQGVVEAFAEAAARDGVPVVRADVATIERRGSAWSLALQDGARLEAGAVVIAAGYGSPPIVSALGVDLPITKEARYLFFSAPIPERLLEPLVVAIERRFAAKQLADGRLLASDLGADGDPESGRRHWRANVARGIRSLLPQLEFVAFDLLVEGFYDVTPDHQPILGPVEGHEGLWLAAGFSGHGFMMAPAVGRRLADAITGRVVDPSLQELSIGRFGGQELHHELQIV